MLLIRCLEKFDVLLNRNVDGTHLFDQLERGPVSRRQMPWSGLFITVRWGEL